MTNSQNKQAAVSVPIEIEAAVNYIRLLLADLDWVTHPFHIAQRFTRKKNSQSFVYPETYAGGGGKKYRYHRLTPDNDYKGMFFFMVGDEQNDFSPNENNYLTHDVSIIFSCNLKKIDPVKLENGLFTQVLIRDVRRLLTKNSMMFDFKYTINNVSRDLRTVYNEFTLDDIEQYNRAPLQCFRFNLSLTLQEDCGESQYYSGGVIANEGECCEWSTNEF